MRKQFFLGLIVLAMVITLPTNLLAQSTEGTDFWVTFLRANGNGPTGHNLSLVFAAKQTANVHIENTRTGYKKDVIVEGGKTYPLENLNKADCYVGDNEEEKVSNNALHITSDKIISVIASNYGRKTFDVAAIMPTKALMSEYYIQSYSPSSHGSDDPSQGSHFAIVAAEDNVVVDITPTVFTKAGHNPGETFTSDTLQTGQVYYVWTGEGTGDNYDFTGTHVKARGRKKIAVFNGNPHTNIPYKINSRDHVYSQAMPIEYWGKRFALTSSLTTIKETPEGSVWERLDKVRIIALQDSTVVKVNGDTLHIFSFENGDNDDKKHFFEFEFGEIDSKSKWQSDPLRPNIKRDTTDNCFIETSCPCAVHLFLTSNRYDHDKAKGINEKYCNGDPSLIWMNPIEQRIDSLTFGTFKTDQVNDHFINIVTLNEASNLSSVQYDNAPIEAVWKPMTGNPNYVFTRKKIIHGTHTLTADSGFIAHVYGFGDEESYGYPAGGNTIDFSSFITINGKIYKADGDNAPICGDDTVKFGAELNYKYDSIYWNFGDEQDTITYPGTDTLPHFYESAGVYKGAYALIYRHLDEDNECINLSNYDSIAFIVNVGNYKIDIDTVTLPDCSKKGDPAQLTVYLNNPAGISLTNDSVKLTFDAVSKAAGFNEATIQDQGDTILYFPVPANADGGVQYGFHLRIGSECPNSVLDKDLHFTIEYAIPLLAQRYNNVLGLIADSVPANEIWDDFYWKKDDQVLPDEKTSVLVIEEDESNNGEYRLCYTIKEAGKPDKEKCTCPINFTASDKKHEFAPDTTSLAITASYIVDGQKVFVNADWEGKTDIECYAQWITSSGNAYQGMKFDIPDGGCTIPVPAENGFYILRVVTDGSKRSFKFIINH